MSTKNQCAASCVNLRHTVVNDPTQIPVASAAGDDPGERSASAEPDLRSERLDAPLRLAVALTDHVRCKRRRARIFPGKIGCRAQAVG